jgi:hypothetical protein
MIDPFWPAWAALLLMAAAIGGAIGRRIDGGVLQMWTGRDPGKIATRLILAVAIAFPMQLAGLPAIEMLAFVAATWVGGVVGMWSGMSMGRVGDMQAPPVSTAAWLSAFGFMTLYGVGTVLPAVGVLWWFGWSFWPTLIVGLLCAPIYEIAFRWPWHIPRLGCFRYDPPPTAELVWGALRGVAAVATVLAGRVG